MTKTQAVASPTLQDFFQAQKAPNTRSRAKSLKATDNGLATPSPKTTRKTRTPSTIVRTPIETTEVTPTRIGTKRRAEVLGIGLDVGSPGTPKKQKTERSGVSTPRVIAEPSPRLAKGDLGFADIFDSNSAEGVSAESEADVVINSETIETLEIETPSRKAAETVIRQSTSSEPRSNRGFTVIDTPQRAKNTNLNKSLPSPGGDDTPEVHNPRDFPPRSSLPTTPISSPAKPIKLSTINRDLLNPPSVRGPAYQRYKHLVAPDKKLGLPAKYEVLEKMFHGLEYTVMFMKGRDQRCVYHKIRKAVENMCHRNFEMRNLAQIRTVYPEAYKYSMVLTVEQGVRVASICIDVTEEGKPIDTDEVPDTPTKNKGMVSSVIRGGSLAGPMKSAVDSVGMRNSANEASKQMGERRKEFHRRLEMLVRTEHNKFLKSISHTTLSEENHSRLTAWHPKFDLESVPEVVPADMPELKDSAPDFRSSTARERAAEKDDSKSRLSSESDVDPAAQEQQHQPPLPSIPNTPTSTGRSPKDDALRRTAISAPMVDDDIPSTPTKPAKEIVMPDRPTKPKSRAAALLERIRDREKKKVEADMYGPRKDTAAEIRRKAMLSRLGDVAQALSFMYANARKDVLGLPYIAQSLSNSLPSSISEVEAREHVKLLAEIAPEWCTVTELSLVGTVVRIERGELVKNVKDKIRMAMLDMDAEKLRMPLLPGSPSTPIPSTPTRRAK
ncbi:hypothetical protein PhCBS80983_g05355 [Powellomyces hirtus]|uniref:CDT1 Geminin-binding domain-containing protein n=1 Tax=Powellomyces hirtus TaxID=109895 RepID=A0A507DW31_9FUNG|nr:hypothetical protein PhCBS80983_g05355 [Powellomyces hirtus]